MNSNEDAKHLQARFEIFLADRAKSIKTQAVVNENATDRLIRELREENQRLAESLKGGGASAGGSSEGIKFFKPVL